MLRLVVLLAIFAAFVYVGYRWRQDRQRRKQVNDALAAQMGRRGVVTEAVSAEGGLVRINGEGYAACSDAEIGPRVLVEVVGVRRFRLLVGKVEGKGQLVDVDHIVDRETP